jgi:hypothetical protein
VEVDYFIGGGAGPACMKDLVVKPQAIDIIDLILQLITHIPHPFGTS